MRAHMREELFIHALGGAPERKLPESGKIAGRKIMVERALGLLRHIDLALAKPLHQLVRRQVDDFDVIGGVEHGIGHGLAHADVRDLRDHVVQAFDMLDVQRGVDVDAGGEQLLHVEIALRVAASRRVRMREFVHQRELRPPRENGVEVHLLHRPPPVIDNLAGDDFKAGDERLRLGAGMGFHDPDRDIGAVGPPRARRQQHFIGLADARRRAQEDFEPPAPFLLLARKIEKRFGRRTLSLASHDPWVSF